MNHEAVPVRYPSPDEIIQLVVDSMYSSRVLNNSHRGDVVEAMVLAALGPDWRFCGLGWHPWDFQRGQGDSRVRIQVKNSAALQLWGKTQRPSLKFGWSKQKPYYADSYYPDEAFEDEGWFCDVFVFGIHQGTHPSEVDHRDPSQWRFMVIPTCDLNPRTDSMVLSKALTRWSLVRWHEIAASVDAAIARSILLWRDGLCPTGGQPSKNSQ